MSKCLDRTVGDMLYDYEVGILADGEMNLVEAHLLECSYCRELMLEHQDVSELLREDSEVKELLVGLGQESSTTESDDSGSK